MERIKKITPEEISKVASSLFILENLNLNLIFPKKIKFENDKHLKKMILDIFNISSDPCVKDLSSYVSKDYSMSKIVHSKPTRITLNCGADLLVLQNTKTPLFSLRSVSMGGLRQENKASNGKFSILAELFERGSKNFSKDQLSMKTELLASDIEGYSGKNTLGLKLLGPSANLQELIEIYSDVISNPLFIEKELEIVKRDTMSYLNRKKQNYAALTADKFYEKLFPNHPYSMNQYGTEESLVNISQDNISKAYRETITKNNLLFSAVGNFDLEQLVECLNSNLDISDEDFLNIKDSTFTPIKEDQNFETKLGDKQQSHIMIGTYAPSMESQDQYAFQVMNSCLSGMGGRLFLELRDRKSLAYTVSSFYSPSPTIGHFGVYIGCSPEKKDESIEAINKEISKLVTDGITSSEIERSKNYLIGRNDISLQRNASINARISQGCFFGLGPEEPFEFSSKIRNVTLEEVNKVILKYLSSCNKVIVAYEPS